MHISIHRVLRSRSPRRRNLLGAGVASLLTVALVSIGYGFAASSAATARASKAPFVFGLSYAESGPLAPPATGAGPFVQAWFKYVNAHGGVQGHKLQVDV